MELCKLNPETFMRHVGRVNERLAHREQAQSLLDAARAEIPMIKMILDAVHMYRRCKGRDAREALVRVERDLVTFLALRAVEQEQNAKPQAAESPAACCGRRADDNHADPPPKRAG